MPKSIRITLWIMVLALCLTPLNDANAATPHEKAMQQEIDALKIRVEKLENLLQQALQNKIETAQAGQKQQAPQQVAAADKKEAQKEAEEEKSPPEGITVGGAVRFQYSYERYNEGNRERGGDLDFDIFRIDLNGKVKDITLSAQWRWYQYMNAVHHAWFGYDFNASNSVKLGITKVPFGILPFDSHSFFFSSNFYLGLEDDYDAGVNYHFKQGPWDLRLAYYQNDELGGVDGYVDNRSNRYSYDIVGYRVAGEGIYADPSKQLGEHATLNGRMAYTFGPGDPWNIELGLSGRYGQLVDSDSNAGDYNAYAAHLVANYGRWNLQLEAASYEYNVDAGADLMVVGAYAFYDTIPAKADTYTANLAYSLPVDWGPISKLTFYNDYSLVTNKSADLPDTWMNDTGILITAGDVYTYVDFVTARNQPFIGGSMAGDSDSTEHRVNINFGYYF